MKSVKAIASYIKDTFKIELELSDVIRMSAEALKLLGAFATGNELIIDRIDDNYKIHLPRVSKIEAVIRMQRPNHGVKVFVEDIIFPTQDVFVPVEPAADEFVPICYPANYINQLKGFPYMDFTWNCPYLSFNEKNLVVAILATTVAQDKEGYPMIPDEAFLACAYYCAYTWQLPLLILGKIDPNIFAKVEQLKERKFGQARAGMLMEALNQNELDKLGNIMASMDRKAFNRPM